MKIKTLIFTAVLTTALLFSTGSISAQTPTVDQLLAQIQALIAQLNELQASQGNQGGDTIWCHTFISNNDSSNGISTSEVASLQIALQQSGLYPMGAVSQQYDADTVAGVAAFQKKYGFRQSGLIGPKTVEKLNKLYGCRSSKPACVPNWKCSWGPCVNGGQQWMAIDSNNCGLSISNANIPCQNMQQKCSTQSSITITSPNGGEQWQAGNTYNIKWQSRGVGNVMIELTKNNPDSGWHLVYSVPASVGSYSWTIPSSGSSITTASDYKIKIWDTTNTAVTDSSDNYFTITSATTSQPTITSFTVNGAVGPRITVGVGSTIALAWASTNAETCSVMGDRGSNDSNIWYGSSGTVSVSPTANITYTVTCYKGLNTNNLQQASSSIAIQILDTTQPTITSINPTQVTKGTDPVITLTGARFTSSMKVMIQGDGADFTTAPLSVSPDGTTMTFKLINIMSTVSNVYTPGIYSISVYQLNTSLASNDVALTIVAPTVSIPTIQHSLVSSTINYSYNASSPANSVTSGVITFKAKPYGGDLSQITSDNITVQLCNSNASCSSTGVLKNVTANPSGNILDGTEATVTVSATYTGASGYVYFRISEIDWVGKSMTSIQKTGLDIYKTPSVNAYGVISQPSIIVTSPNGGESFPIGTAIPVTFTSNLPVGTAYQVVLNAGSNHVASQGGVITNASSQTMSFAANGSSAGDTYRFNINAAVNGVVIQDTSDNSFTITAPAPTTCTPNWSCTAWGSCSNTLNNSQKDVLTVQIKLLQIQLKEAKTSTQKDALNLQIRVLQAQLLQKQQIRTCADLNNCGVVSGQPVLAQSCVVALNNNLAQSNLASISDAIAKLLTQVQALLKK